MNKVNMRTLDSKERIKNFDEVAIGYSHDEAIKEANRCLNCQNPRCVSGCPVGIEIPKFIEAIKNEKIDEAYSIISRANLFPAICGRVCPQENQCEKMCIKGFKGGAISIGSLERYVADNVKEVAIERKESNGLSVGVIGSGPSGLTCASNLAKMGYDVTIYESLHKAGGVLAYGIPKFRLPKNILEQEISNLKSLGVKIKTNTIIGVTLTLDELKQKHDAIYIASGAGLPKLLNVENESAIGVFTANEILTRVNLMGEKTPIYAGENVLVIGGGNVALDAARTLKRLGKNVTIVYRREISDMPARREEVKHAMEEEIKIKTLVSPNKILVDEYNKVIGLEVNNMKIDRIDNNGRRKIVETGKKEVITCNMIVSAIGTTPNPILINNSNLKTDNGLILVDDSRASDDKIYAGGDAVTGAATVILAMEAGKKAAKKIDEELN